MSWPYRNYSTYLGRWLQAEKLGMIPNDNEINPFFPPWQYMDGLNLYEYVASNPIIGLDQSGLKKKSSMPVDLCFETFIIAWWKGYPKEKGCCNPNLKIITWDTPLKKAWWGDPLKSTYVYTIGTWDDAKKVCIIESFRFYLDRKREEGNVIKKKQIKCGFLWSKSCCEYTVKLTMRRYHAYKLERIKKKLKWIKDKKTCEAPWGFPAPKIVSCVGASSSIEACD